ncbi:MAG: hypothetical protein IRZ00_03185 [Gemmatimonadetes bacterium]|nr:hypothetical protein [Gemmatimonadota bacterium]
MEPWEVYADLAWEHLRKERQKPTEDSEAAIQAFINTVEINVGHHLLGLGWRVPEARDYVRHLLAQGLAKLEAPVTRAEVRQRVKNAHADWVLARAR